MSVAKQVQCARLKYDVGVNKHKPCTLGICYTNVTSTR